MQVHVFKGLGKWYGFTADRTGMNLPAAQGPWAFVRTEDMDRGENPRVAVSTEDVLTGIAALGYFVTSVIS